MKTLESSDQADKTKLSFGEGDAQLLYEAKESMPLVCSLESSVFKKKTKTCQGSPELRAGKLPAC